jgi:endonuclease/exonuclease/phosphatase family metal-dependent hydrolase
MTSTSTTGLGGARRLVLIAIAAMAAIVTALWGIAPAASAPGAPDRELRVIDYNIRAGRGLDTAVGGDLDKIAAVIRDSGAEVVTLQEVDRHFSERSGFVDQAAYLGTELGMHVAYGANLEWAPLEPGQPPRQYGTAILSRYPILESENIPLPIHGAPRPAPEDPPIPGDVSEPRGLLRAVINVRGVHTTVLTTHLQSDETSPSLESARQQRAEQVAVIMSVVAQAQANGPVILAGDLNSPEGAEELAPLYGPLQDAWLVAGDGGPGLTAYLPLPDRRIDYVFTTPDVTVGAIEVRQAQESDHLPVVVDLSLPGPGTDRGPQHKVVLFAMDGFDADYLDGRIPLPNLDRLARRGVLMSSMGVMSSMTNQSWASVATGAFPERTLNASYYLDDTGVVRGQSRANAAQTIGESLVASGHTIASVQWFMLQDRGVSYGDPDALYTQPGGTCQDRADDAVAILSGQPVDSGGTMVTAPEVPDLLAVYCSDIDSAGHATGENSPETLAALAHVDEQIGRVVEATRQAGTYQHTTFILTGDHGITTYDDVNGPQVEAAIDALGYQAEWVSTNSSPSPGTNVVLAGAGLTSIHLIGDLEGDAEALARIDAALAGVEGVGQTYDKAEQAAMRMAPQYGELVIEPEPGWAMFAEDAPFPRGRHGTTQELQVAFLLSGSGIIPGQRFPDDPRHVDIAPTIAQLLGAPIPADAQGRVLTEILVPPRR